jgi:hypothetical protein
MSLFGLKTLVHPIYTGFRNSPHWEDYPPNYTTAADAQKQGGAVTYVHPGMTPVADQFSARELPVDLALGQVDAMDVVSNVDEFAAMEVWYKLLNCGFKLAVSAGTDSFTNVADHYAPGGGRVYVQAGESLRYDAWIENYKRGRSFAGNGPVLFLEVAGKGPGEEIRLAAPQNVRVKATLRSALPVDKLEVVVNGEPVISRAVSGRKELTVEHEIPLQGSSWVAARAVGPQHRLILNDVQAFAHTSPVYVSVAGRPARSGADAGFFVDWIDRLMARVEERGRFSTPERKKEVLALFARAREVYRKIVKEAGQ